MLKRGSLLRVCPVSFQKERLTVSVLKVAKLSVYTTDKTWTVLSIEYNEKTSSPLLVAERIIREGFTDAHGKGTVVYPPASIVKVNIVRPESD